MASKNRAGADEFHLDVDSFIFQYQQKAEELVKLGVEMQQFYKECLIKFGGRPNTESEDFFGPIASFLRRFADAQAKVLASKDLHTRDMVKMRRSLATTMSMYVAKEDASATSTTPATPATKSGVGAGGGGKGARHLVSGPSKVISGPSKVVHLASGNADSLTRGMTLSAMPEEDAGSRAADEAIGYIDIVGTLLLLSSRVCCLCVVCLAHRFERKYALAMVRLDCSPHLVGVPVFALGVRVYRSPHRYALKAVCGWSKHTRRTVHLIGTN